MLANVVEHVHAPYANAGWIGAGAMAHTPLTTVAEQVRAGEQLLERVAERGEVDMPSGGSSPASTPSGSPMWPTKRVAS